MAIIDSVRDKNSLETVDAFDESDQQDHETEPESYGKATLDDLLSLMRKADEAVDEFEIDLEKLGNDLRSKVDAITEYLDYCEARVAAIRPRAAMLAKMAQNYEKRAKQLREYVANSMHADAINRGEQHNEKQKLPGVNYEFLLCYSQTVEPIKDPDPAIYLKLKGKFVRRSYAWNKIELKNGLMQGNEEIAAFATLKKNPYIKIKPKA